MNTVTVWILLVIALVSGPVSASCTKIDYAEFKDLSQERKVRYYCQVKAEALALDTEAHAGHTALMAFYKGRHTPPPGWEASHARVSARLSVCLDEAIRVRALLNDQDKDTKIVCTEAKETRP